MWTDGEKGAILQRDKESLAVVPHTPCGVVTSDQLRTIADTADKYDVKAMKITSAARIAMIGLDEKQVDSVWQDLGMKRGAAAGSNIRSIKACPGTSFCKKGMQDSLAIGLELDEKYHGMEVTGKLKLAVSGCNLQCAENCIKDISLVGMKNGWNLLLGGCGGSRPRLADTIAKNLSDDQADYYIDRCITYFKENAKKNERMSRFLDRVGLEVVLNHLFKDKPLDDEKLAITWDKDNSAA